MTRRISTIEVRYFDAEGLQKVQAFATQSSERETMTIVEAAALILSMLDTQQVDELSKMDKYESPDYAIDRPLPGPINP
jgi:hypothetical protein